ncbi:unnamed protein product [Linum tenue]|uniref:RNase H type-1 domain-containing protein n=1 Tax=Linum tenue TaxID=586396 RepID=A0AAV0KB90_9ROSI|nr:unnamed protein product [Linum tenue]
MGLGVVIRNDERWFLLAAAKRVQGNWSVEMAEALAVEFGAQLAWQMHYPRPIIELDCQTVVQNLQAADDVFTGNMNSLQEREANLKSDGRKQVEIHL